MLRADNRFLPAWGRPGKGRAWCRRGAPDLCAVPDNRSGEWSARPALRGGTEAGRNLYRTGILLTPPRLARAVETREIAHAEIRTRTEGEA